MNLKKLHKSNLILLLSFISFSFLAILFFVLPKDSHAQIGKPKIEYVKFFTSIDKKEVKKGDTISLIINGEIINDFYMYGPKFAAEGPLKSELEITNLKGLKALDSLNCENCKTKYDEIWEGNISYAEHNIKLVQKYIVTDPSYAIQGKIKGQACKPEGICVQVEGNIDFSGTGVQKKSPEENEKKVTPFSNSDESFWQLILLAIGGGIVAILTPCVYPMIPMTVTFFLKRNKDRKKAIFEALLYCFFIIFIYTFFGLMISAMFGQSALSAISTHWLPNLIFFSVFIVFGLSFLGLFEITLPNSIINKADQNSERSGIVGIFFMAFTLVLISFSCTGPIASSLLVGAHKGDFWRPTIGMFAFSSTFALPFGIFAMFPNLLASLPKSGSWLNTVKVTFGLAELAFAFKFINQADPDNDWGFLSRDIFIGIHVAIAFVTGLYLLGIVAIGYESTEKKIGAIRTTFAIGFLVLGFYMLPGMFGAKLLGLSGYLPAYNTQEFKISSKSKEFKPVYTCGEPIHFLPKHQLEGINQYFEFNQASQCARESQKLLFIDFTGKSCQNCREMEEFVFSKPDITQLFNDNFVFVSLFNDDTTVLPETEWITSKIDGETKKTIGEQNIDIQMSIIGIDARPFYVIYNPDTKKVIKMIGYSKYNVFKEFLLQNIK